MQTYSIQVQELAEGYVLYIPELCLIEECTDLSAGWARLQERRQELLDAYGRNGLEKDMPPPRGQQGEGDNADIRRFSIKAAIIALTFVVVIVTSAVSLSYLIRDPLRVVGQRLGKAAIAQVVKGVRDSTVELSEPNKQREFQDLLARLAPVVQPYNAGIRQMLSMDCQSAKPQ